jgi:hypothetical protein
MVTCGAFCWFNQINQRSFAISAGRGLRTNFRFTPKPRGRGFFGKRETAMEKSASPEMQALSRKTLRKF